MAPPDSMTATNSHQRAYSVMAVPSELDQHRHSKHRHYTSNNKNDSIWYQEVYKKYGYDPKLKSPSYFGPYLLLQTLGEGEFAKVKAGVHVQTNQEVAIKLMRKDHIKMASLETKLEREISVLKQPQHQSVDHPYIVKLFEVLTIKNYIGIVLQRAAGGELFDYILKHHFLQETEAKRLFAQLISGVDYMHQKHIVHRDLKLENLLLSKDRDIIITDFGFANRFQVAEQDLMATSCGSPCYAAPELVINDESQYVGTAVDIWSCGVILFAMLCGYLPFDDDPTNPQGANINVLYKYIVSTRLEIPNSMSIDATHLLRRMLVPDPTKRCTMDEIKRHPWLTEHRHLFSFQDHMTSDSRLPAPAAEQQQQQQQQKVDDNSTTILPLSNDEPESRKAATVQAPSSLSSPPTPKSSHSSTSTASTSSSSVINTTTTTANTTQPSLPVSSTTATTTTATSFLQAKFISALQQQQQLPPLPSPPSSRRSYQPPTFTKDKIPNRSVSVQPQLQQKYSKRDRTTSECHSQKKHHSLQVLPSVSEQPTIHDDISFSDKAKLKGQKFMEWFTKRSSKSQSTKLSATNQNKVPEKQPQQQQQRPISALPNPIRAMPIGKPFGSYAADFNDSKLRLHRGAVDQDALTSKAPNEVLVKVKECLTIMGIDMKKCHDFKIKCVRPARRRPEKVAATAAAPSATSTIAGGAGARTRKNTTTIPFKLFFNSGSSSSNNHILPKTTATTSTTNIIYGEQGIDNGEQIQFNVELSKIENLPGLYVVDIKRTRGNIWAFKFLYHTLLELLDLSGQGGLGYMAHRRISSEKMQDGAAKDRKSYMTTSSSGSSGGDGGGGGGDNCSSNSSVYSSVHK
ncbi:hypothetical protein [Parasitella parasitica]|uniref:non-specific serine/threonine protein kinase n=1 Tax=Parasitella parasitica TaxID=35722 RepID=A0A0B7MX62_9FUNG|nr:hypothetical protein [Parasitella parasitica]